jgi:hypothetical protein
MKKYLVFDKNGVKYWTELPNKEGKNTVNVYESTFYTNDIEKAKYFTEIELLAHWSGMGIFSFDELKEYCINSLIFMPVLPENQKLLYKASKRKIRI